MRVEVERLRMEVVLSQPAPSLQDDLSPRRSPAVGPWSHEPGVPRAEMQSTKNEEVFPLQASVDAFLHICTSPEQETIILLQADVGVDDTETTTINAQAAFREEFARPPKNRQQLRVIA